MARVIEFGPGCDIPAARRRPTAAEAARALPMTPR